MYHTILHPHINAGGTITKTNLLTIEHKHIPSQSIKDTYVLIPPSPKDQVSRQFLKSADKDRPSQRQRETMSGLKRLPSRMGSVHEASSAPKSKTKEEANTKTKENANAKTKEDTNVKTKEDANATIELSKLQGETYVEKLEKILNKIKGIAQKNKQKDEAATKLQEVIKAMKKIKR